ncbi:asparagine synthase (glutamine-hydrolyzing) [bacterium]|nr:asparagine synthase (glutamine-hydrolyzing) [bacterium]
MCGICGFSYKDIDPESLRSVLKDMCDTMIHRGPDDWGAHVEDRMALGMRRLSIIDLKTGHQPLKNEDGSLWLVYNGEIYNFPGLRKDLIKKGHRFSTCSDGEAILHLYEEKGEDFVEYLNGMFGIALWDSKKKRLILARDRMGIKPLHYMINKQGHIAFASELKALLKYPYWEPGLDMESLDLYLTYEYVPTPKTIYKGVLKLPPGHMLIYKDGNARLKEYWDMDYSSGESSSKGLNETEYEEKFLELLKASVKRRLISDVPLGTFLSGGIDSSMITALAHDQSNYPIESYQIGFLERSFDESSYAEQAANHIGINHRQRMFDTSQMLEVLPKVFDFLDEPFGDASLLPTFLLCRFCRENVTVALSGDGGDELFAGYYTYQAHRLAKFYLMMPRLLREGIIEPVINKMPVSAKNFSLDFRAKRFITGITQPTGIRHTLWMGSLGPHDKARLFRPQFLDALAGHDTYDPVRRHIEKAKANHPLHEILYLDAKLYLQDDLLVKVDRASMANSLEVRVPFLDHTCVDFVTRMPPEFKLKGLKTKYLLKKTARHFLPGRIINRHKKGFGIPVAKWIKGELRELFQDTFAPDRIRREGIFDPDFISKMLNDHMAGNVDNRKSLWTLFMFEQWRAGRYFRGS